MGSMVHHTLSSVFLNGESISVASAPPNIAQQYQQVGLSCIAHWGRSLLYTMALPGLVNSYKTIQQVGLCCGNV